MNGSRNQKVTVFAPAPADNPHQSARRRSWEVRWSVIYGPKGKRRRLQRSRAFPTKGLAMRFWNELQGAADLGTRFDLTTGLPSGLTGTSETVVRFAVRWFRRQVADGQWAAKTQDANRDGLVHILRATCDADPPASVLKKHHRSQSSPLHQWIRDALTTTGGTAAAGKTDVSVVRAGEWLEAHSLSLDELDVATITKAVLPALRRNPDGTPAATATFNRRRATLTSMLNAAVAENVIAANPAAGLRLPRSQHVRRSLDVRTVPTVAEWRTFICAACYGSDAGRRRMAYLATVLYTGARPGELNGLRRSDLTLPDGDGEWGEMVLSESHTTATRRSTRRGVATGPLKHRSPGTTRVVSLHPDLVVLLRLHLQLWPVEAHEHVFRTATGALFGENMARYMVRGRERMGWVGQHPFADAVTYTGRHGFVSLMLHGGFDPTEVAEMVGNTPSVVTDFYASVINRTRHERRRKMGEAFG